ncbi:MAPEG family protein [Lysobacter sp. TLK-CK17T]|uniref:MAPEG family protein n=2 Tax=Marilutibacter chinensis TaxID=2912247 RepID=A0ABS9HXH7_9GAMM|nr:MAPEG family protein [Lysobacter chinensis]
MPAITLLFASLFVLFNLVLMARVSLARRSSNVGIGSGGDPLLRRRVRVHANFIEQVPIALLLMALLELAGLAQAWLWAFGVVLLAGRLLHARGLSASAGYSYGRFLGTVLSWGVLLAEAVAGLAMAARHLG